MADTKNEAPEFDNRPASQRDLEARLDQGFRPLVVDNTENDVLNPEVVVNPWKGDDNDTSGYLGVSPEYMNYANETEKPVTATEGPEAESLRRLQTGVPGVIKTEKPDDNLVEEVGGQRVENLNTAVSGEGFSSKLVDKPAEVGPTRVVLDEQSQAALDEQKPKAPAAPAPVPAKAAAPAAKRSSNS